MSTTPLETVGVVTVNYNAGKHLLNAVNSFAKDGANKVVVVDNGSSDRSVEALSASGLSFELLKLNNPGFGAANNAGEKLLDTDVVCLMNPDTVVSPGAFEAARQRLNSDSRIAIVGPRILNADGTDYPSFRDFPSLSEAVGHGLFSIFWPNNPWSRRYKRLDIDHTTMQESDWVSGAAMFVRRSAFESVNGFDESFFMYFEDTDLCWRLRHQGWKIVYDPAAVVTHVQGVSTNGVAYRSLKNHHQSAIRYNLKTTRGAARALLPLFVVGLAIRLPIAWLNEWNKRRKR